MAKPLSNRIALLTGGSRGIGFSTAVALARDGAHVVATARTQGGLEELDDAIGAVGGTATLVPLDLRDYEGIGRLAKALDERYGRLDVLVGNAALGGSNSPLDHFPPQEWEELYAVNVTAQWQFIRHMHPLLLRSDAARAVFLTSGGATNPRPYRGLYGSTKAALEIVVRTYAAECASTGIRANLFNPGPTRTRMRAAAMPGEDPMTLPHPDEVAAAIVPLCRPECTENGRLYDFRFKRFLTYRTPE